MKGGRREGQALAEMAIFGSIMLIMVAGLVRIGLQYVYQQQVTQDAFRTALYYGNDRAGGPNPGDNVLGQGAVFIGRDRYIPDATRPFAAGRHVPFTASSSVTWGNRAYSAEPNRREEVPSIQYFIDGKKLVLPTAKFVAYVTSGGNAQYFTRIFCGLDADAEEAEKEACLHRLHHAERDVIGGAVTWNGMTIPVVGSDGLNQKTIIALDDCAGAVANDTSRCARRCNQFQRHVNQGLIVPPYCGVPGKSLAPVGEDNLPTWEWSNLPKQGFEHGPDMLGTLPWPVTRTTNKSASVTNQGPFGVQDFRKVQYMNFSEQEAVTNRKFKGWNAGPPNTLGSYAPVQVDFSILSIKENWSRTKHKKWVTR